MGSSRSALLGLALFVALVGPAVPGAAVGSDELTAPHARLGAPDWLTAPHATLDAPDWPTAIDVDRDGTVWLSMATDTPDFGGVARYSADLEFEGGWGIAGSPHAIAVGPSRDVYVDENESGPALISRFTLGGDHTQSWSAGDGAADLDAAPNGDVIELEGITGDEPISQRIVAFGSTGKRLDHWEAPNDSLSLATDRRGHVFVGQRTGGLGAIWHYSMSGTRLGKWSITNLPKGIDIGPDDRLYSAGTYGTGRGDVLIFERDGSFVTGIMVDAQPEDVAVAPDGSVYLIVWVTAENRYEVHKYDPAGELLIRLEDIHPIQGFPRPPTATAGPPPTAPTPRWPSPTPRPASATPARTASATDTGGVSATPTPTADRTAGTPGTSAPTAPTAPSSTAIPTEGDLRTPTPQGDAVLYVPMAAKPAGGT